MEALKNKIKLGCALEILPTITSGTIDVILTDPPYGDDSGYGRMDKTILGNDGPDINRQIMPDLYRILKQDHTAYIFTNWKFCHLIRQWAEDVGFTPVTMIVVVKNNIGMGGSFRNQHEICWVLRKGTPKYVAQTSNVINMEHVAHDQNTHPHQKGVKLIKKLLLMQELSQDSLVFDCFSGSGTTAIACEEMKLNFICIEKDPQHHKNSLERLDLHRAQGSFL